ncbi:hypothetical protein LB519_14875 [Mesorhizobium sp. AD1-1]|uniref:hypothetical protein n=1 Tax=Mesorhizobium sp. AD1-1 TaxID=2876621 RepID=UPI001CCB7DFA|nr:hypothetical protein [Mesorhizobium sp. AD1-1]MBZ9719130.1 hypothetical protein [Mesorhizobium sp. AD1-1]
MITFQQPPANTAPAGAIVERSIVERPLVERMAERVLELGMNGTAVTKDVLAEHTEFTRAEIDAHAADACDLAKARAVRRVG